MVAVVFGIRQIWTHNPALQPHPFAQSFSIPVPSFPDEKALLIGLLAHGQYSVNSS